MVEEGGELPRKSPPMLTSIRRILGGKGGVRGMRLPRPRETRRPLTSSCSWKWKWQALPAQFLPRSTPDPQVRICRAQCNPHLPRVQAENRKGQPMVALQILVRKYLVKQAWPGIMRTRDRHRQAESTTGPHMARHSPINAHSPGRPSSPLNASTLIPCIPPSLIILRNSFSALHIITPLGAFSCANLPGS